MTIQAQATNAVVRFVTEWRLDRFPSDAVSLAKQCIVDGLGVILAGSTTRASRIVREYVREGDTAAEATVLGAGSFRCRAASAALANGTAGHAMDFDDTQVSAAPDRIFGLLTHPTVPPLAAGLALGERLGVSGTRLLEAYLIGLDVECKIAEAIDPSHYRNGFHTSGTIGTFGATACAARLLGLDALAVAHALGIAASMCSGIRVNFGTMTKPLHVGRAAHNGVVAADLAVRGFTGARDALDGPWGFFQIFSFGAGFDPEALIGTLGNPPSILHPGVSLKPYPCGCLGHPSMDAMAKLVIEHDVRPEQIQAIRLRAGTNILNPLRYQVARNELEAKFCPAFMLSSIALRRSAGIHEFSDAFVQSAPVQELMARVTTILDPDIEARGPDRMRSIVEVDLTDGRTLRQEADERYRGGPERPFTPQELRGKFVECAGLVLAQDAAGHVFDLVSGLDEVGDVRMVVRALSGGGVAEAVPGPPA